MDIITYVMAKKYVDTQISENSKNIPTGALKLVGQVSDITKLPKSHNKDGDVYIVGEENSADKAEYYWFENQWNYLGETPVDLSNYYTRLQTDDLINSKVDKVSGKGLSSNDFTNDYKSKLDGLESYDDTEVRADIDELSKAVNFNRTTLGYTTKNLLPNRCSSRTAYGVTSTVNVDGSITLNGTASRTFILYASLSDGINDISDTPSKKVIPNGNYYLSGDITGKARLQLYLFDDKNDGVIKFSGNVTVDDTYLYNCLRVAVVNGINFDNETLYPMLRYADITDGTYEPYKPTVDSRFSSLENRIAVLDSTDDFNALSNKTADFYFIKEE